MPERTKTRKFKTDAFLADATQVALDAARDVARIGAIGDHAGFDMLDERLGIHYFSSTEPGYVGWRWGVTVARVPRGRKVTVCEVDLIPGEGSLLAPEWIPWEDRLLPGDISRDDVLPYRADDARLDQGYEATGLDADEVLTDEMGLGRPRVLSAKGRAEAIKRWYNSEQGPKPGRLPKSTCSTCGFLLKMSGSMRTVFGVCANAWAADDGRVVSLDHACGSHSETDVPRRESEWPVRPSRINDFQVESAPMPTQDEATAAGTADQATQEAKEASADKGSANTLSTNSSETAEQQDTASAEQPQDAPSKAAQTAHTPADTPADGAPEEAERNQEDTPTQDTKPRTRARKPRQSAIRTRAQRRTTRQKD